MQFLIMLLLVCNNLLRHARRNSYTDATGKCYTICNIQKLKLYNLSIQVFGCEFVEDYL